MSHGNDSCQLQYRFGQGRRRIADEADPDQSGLGVLLFAVIATVFVVQSHLALIE
jgi:hypothetical protein